MLTALIVVVATPQAPAHPVASSELSSAYDLSAQYRVGDHFMGLQLLGALTLRQVKIDGQLVAELSALAWDEDEQILYAVSDGGRLFHLIPEFADGVLSGVAGAAGYPLRDANGQALRGVRADSEGLALENAENGIRGDSRLVISFERRPRLVRYTPSGRFVDTIPLPAPLTTAANYASSNKSLESVARHPSLGWLVAPERPMRHGTPGVVRISGASGGYWDYRLREAPGNSLVALEALSDGSLVTLERGYGLMYLHIVIALRRTGPLVAEPGSMPAVSTVAVLDSTRGWRVDNFEGLARHRGLNFFLVSDDNENALQRTLLLYIRISDPAPKDYVPPKFDALQKNAQ
jgi:hypothetical protein